MTRDALGRTATVPDAVLRGAILLMVAGCAGVWLWGGSNAASVDTTPTIPTPWDEATVGCPVVPVEGSRAQAMADEAATMWERSFFDWSDAPRAITRLSQAAACARAAGDLSALDRHLARVEEWKRHVRRLQDREALRLELAERHQDPEAMHRHALRLGALLQDGDPERVGEARSWLLRMQRRARARLAGLGGRGEDEDE